MSWLEILLWVFLLGPAAILWAAFWVEVSLLIHELFRGWLRMKIIEKRFNGDI